MAIVKAAVAVVAGLLLVIVAFRRARGVLTPDVRRIEARQNISLRRVGVGLTALVAIVWLTRQLFT
jgi:hypothetical protein